METEQLQMIFIYLDKIAQKLGTTADYLWPMLIKQQYIEAIYSGIIFILALPCFITLGIFITKHWRPKEGYSIYDNDHEPLWVIPLIIFGVCSFFSGVFFLAEVPDIFNPEYWALKDLIKMVK